MLRALVIGCAALAACAVEPGAARDPVDSGAKQATTPAEIVVANLDRRIRHRERRSQSGRATVLDRKLLISDRLKRGQFFGTVGDYIEAHSQALELASARPRDESAQRLWAQAAAALHRWDEVESALARAKSAGADTAMTAAIEADLAVASGQLRRAVALRESLANRRPTPYNVAGLGVVLAEAGQIDAAERQFERALASYRGSSPLPLAWILFQRGIMWERAGRPGRAVESYERGLRRLPSYAPLASHLAGLLAERDQLDRAIAVIAKVALRSDDPRLAGQMALLLQRAGAVISSAAYRAVAERGYRDLLARHSRAFADHAVEFYLQLDDHGARAFELARQLASDAPSDRRFQRLLMTARVAQRSARERCDYADEAADLEHPSANLVFLRAQAYRDCRRRAAERAVLATAGEATRER